MKRSDFRAYARTVKSSFPDKPAPPGKRRGDFEIYTQNKLGLNYPGAIGIKTGWTTQARGTFIGAATRDGRTLLVTVMNTRQGAWREGAALLDWGFANIAAQKPVGTLNAIPEVTLSNGTNGETDPSRATTPAAAATDDSSSMRWLAWPLLTLVVLVAALRTRVLVRRHLRRRRRQADLRLSKRLNATGDQVPYQEDERLAPPHRDDPRETRINRSA
jgi:D-alanyl-D-alanine carboxypeptidase